MGIDKKDKKQVNYYPKSKPLSQKALVTSCHYFLSPMTPVGTENPQHYAVHTQKDKLLHIAWSKISAHWAWVGRRERLEKHLMIQILASRRLQSCLSHLETIAVCRGTTSSQMHGAALWSSSWSIAPHVRRSWTTICWAAEPGREAPWYRTAGVVMLKGRCLKVLAQLQPRAEAQA